MKILTTFNPESNNVLSNKSEPILSSEESLAEAKEIADKLINTLKPLMPAAGLAAPQIGILKQIFIYSWDRSEDNLEIVINPKIIKSEGARQDWEMCFSACQENGISKAAKVTRASSLIVEYYNIKGEKLCKKLNGFAAKVFQHEYDHLNGIVNVNISNIEVKTFQNEQERLSFMNEIRAQNISTYIPPINLE